MRLVLPIVVFALCGAVGAQPRLRAGKTATGISYDVQGQGPAVVLITGSNLDRRMWAREAGWLSAAHTVVRYDLRAHGQSDTAAAPFSHLGDLMNVLAALDIPKASLVGLSAGSTIALDAALEHPSVVERIVLAGPSISGYVPKERPAFVGDLTKALQGRDYRQAANVLLATPVFAAPPEAQALVRQMVTENDRLWTVPREMMKVPERNAVDRLDQVRVPALILIGDQDALQREQAELLGKRIAGARLVVVPGGGHLLNLTSPKEFESLVAPFLR